MRKVYVALLACLLVGCKVQESTSTTTSTLADSEETVCVAYDMEGCFDLKEEDVNALHSIVEDAVEVTLGTDFGMNDGSTPLYKVTFEDTYEVYPFDETFVLLRNINDGKYYAAKSTDDAKVWMEILPSRINGNAWVFRTDKVQNLNSTYAEDVLERIENNGLFADSLDEVKINDGQYTASYIGNFEFKVIDGKLYLNSMYNSGVYIFKNLSDVAYVSPYFSCGGGSYATVVTKNHEAYSLNIYDDADWETVVPNVDLKASLDKLTFDFEWKELKVVDNSTPYTTCGFPVAYALVNDGNWYRVNDDGTLGLSEEEAHPYHEYYFIGTDKNTGLVSTFYLYNDGTVHFGKADFEEWTEEFGDKLCDELGNPIENLKAIVGVGTRNDDDSYERSYIFFDAGWHAYEYSYGGEGEIPTFTRSLGKSKGYTYEEGNDGRYTINVTLEDGTNKEYKGDYIYVWPYTEEN